MIKPGPIAFFFFALSSAELAFGFLQGESFSAPLAFGQIVAIILLVMGLIGWLLAERFDRPSLPGVSASLNEKQRLNVGIAVVGALILFILSNKFIPALGSTTASVVNVYTFFGTFNLSTATLAQSTNAFLFAVVLIPTAEEFFFRGFWANLALAGGKGAGWVALGLILQAVIFVLFHIPAYGVGIVLGVIFTDGLVIGGIDEATGLLDPGILAHVGNNLLAWVLVTGSVLGAGSSGLVTMPALLGVLMVVRWRKGGPVLPPLISRILPKRVARN